MPQARVLLGTEVVMDFMNERQPFYRQTRMLMVAGRVGEFDLWVTAPQVVDLVYLLSEGGKPDLLPRAMERIRGLRTFVQVADLTAANVDRMLASSGQNPEGQLMVNAAIDLRADFLLTHDPDGLENGRARTAIWTTRKSRFSEAFPLSPFCHLTLPSARLQSKLALKL